MGRAQVVATEPCPATPSSREKFTKERSAARTFAKEYFERRLREPIAICRAG